MDNKPITVAFDLIFRSLVDVVRKHGDERSVLYNYIIVHYKSNKTAELYT